MPSSTRATTKRKRPDQPGTPVQVRLQPDQLALVDAWIAYQRDDSLTRPEAIRRLVEKGLKGK